MSLIDEFREALTAEIEVQKEKGTAHWEVRAGAVQEKNQGTSYRSA